MNNIYNNDNNTNNNLIKTILVLLENKQECFYLNCNCLLCFINSKICIECKEKYIYNIVNKLCIDCDENDKIKNTFLKKQI